MDDSARRLATIMAVDIAGYSRATERDDVGAARAVAAMREALRGIADEHRGRIFSTAGDGFMLEFASATEGLQAAADLLRTLNSSAQTSVRVGLHLGEVLDGENGDLLGHGVNVAARLQALAVPGGAIVSKAVQSQARRVEDHALKPLGRVRLDKMAERIEVYALGAAPNPVRLWLRSPGSRRAAAAAVILVLSLAAAGAWVWRQQAWAPTRATVAVAPFTSLNVDAESRLFADNISLSVASALASTGVQVLSRTAPPDRAREARYVVDGDVRRDAEVVYVTVRISDRQEGVMLRTDSFQSPAAEAAALAGRISARIASQAWALQVSSSGRANAALTTGLMRVVELQGAGNYLASYQTARDLAREFPNEPMAHFLHAVNAGYALWDIPTDEFPGAMADARASARRTHQLAPRFGEAYVGDLLLTLRSNWAQRERHLRRGLEVDPNTANVTTYLSSILVDVGRTRDAAPLMEAALAADPYNTLKVGLRLQILLELGQQQEAQAILESAERTWPHHPDLLIERFLAFADFPSGARRILSDPALSEIIEASDGPQPVHLMVRALSTRRAADVESARHACDLERLPRSGRGPETCLIGLTMLGDLDEAFRLAERSYPDQRPLTEATAADFELRRSVRFRQPRTLFRRQMAPFRADPRFIELARRIGLLDYWRLDGNEPDFCETESAPVCGLI
ncbi:MAG: adenylate/guanylate cyclase domain-containing protein [Hyphomonadaceae bacterium]